MTEGRSSDRQAAPLGILACAGPLPIEVAEAGSRQGRSIHIVAIEGFADEAVQRFPHERTSIGEVGRILASFRRAGVREIVIAGAMQRPNLLQIKIDWGFLRNLPTVLALTRGGDDSVLRRVVRFFEGQGLAVVGAADVVPDLLAPAGMLTRTRPSTEAEGAVIIGADLIRALGRFDVGQGVVATPAGIVAVEGIRGTDAMLRDLAPGGPLHGHAEGAVLVKLPKPGQEMRIDLPTIGPETVRMAKAAGLAGIAIGAGATIVLERDRLSAEADEADLFVVGLEEPQGRTQSRPQPDVAADLPGTPAEPVLRVAARRAPTPGDRRDIGIARRVMSVVRERGAGQAVIVSREHVTAIAGRLPLAAFVRAQGRAAGWGWRSLRGRFGVLAVDASGLEAEAVIQLIDAPVLRAASELGLAGIALLGALPGGAPGDQLRAWANEARLFLMAEAIEAVP